MDRIISFNPIKQIIPHWNSIDSDSISNLYLLDTWFISSGIWKIL